jgi:hypothetical protein
MADSMTPASQRIKRWSRQPTMSRLRNGSGGHGFALTGEAMPSPQITSGHERDETIAEWIKLH